MHIQFHVEASPSIGHGHVMRCAAIAERAAERDFETSFVAANGYTTELLQMLSLPTKTTVSSCQKIMVIDHHGSIEPSTVHNNQLMGAKVMLLDEHGPARIVADWVCDVLVGHNAKRTLAHTKRTTYLYGLEYALLRGQFRSSHSKARPGVAGAPRLMIAMGGIDQYRVSLRLVTALSALGFRGPATLVVERDAVTAMRRAVCGWADTLVLTEVSDMAALMIKSDLLVTKLGSLMLEAFCVGLGTVMIEPSRAHCELSASLAKDHADWPAIGLGEARHVDMNVVAQRILVILFDPARLAAMGQRGSELVDGCGCDRLLNVVCGTRAH